VQQPASFDEFGVIVALLRNMAATARQIDGPLMPQHDLDLFDRLT
jgi:hypothetical protein